MKAFNFVFRFTSRGTGTNPAEVPATVDASTLPVAIAKGGRVFWKGLDRKTRFDVLKNGMSIAISVSEKA